MFEQFYPFVPAVGLSLLTTIAMIGYWRLSKRLNEAKQQLSKAQHEIKLLNNSSVGLGRRVVDVEAEMQRRASLASASGLAAVETFEDNFAAARAEQTTVAEPLQEEVAGDMMSAMNGLEQTGSDSGFPFEVHTNEHYQSSQSGLEQTEEDLEQTPYTIASDLLDQGLELDEIEQRCGLSKAEVALMATMHKNMSKFSVV